MATLEVSVGVVIVDISVGVVIGGAVDETLAIVDDGVGVKTGVMLAEVVGTGGAMHIPCMFSTVPPGQTHRNDPTVFSQN